MKRIIFTAFIASLLFIGTPSLLFAATLKLSPSSGTFSAGSTFDVSVYLDTAGKSVNAMEIFLQFPPSMLQLVSPNTGNSIIGVWTSQPRFNNQNGSVELQGGIPGGLNVSNGLITTLKFRVKSVGQAFVKFGANSKVLLNDGLATDVLEQTQNGVYTLVLPPPAGPIVASQTHSDQSHWYREDTVVLNWANETAVTGYSYVLNDDPISTPDDISEGNKNSLTYKNLESGTHYFHIKAFKDASWGGTTHFSIKIDKDPPAAFPLEFVPSKRTSRQQPVLQFSTTDKASGIDHYELKIIPLQGENNDQPLFIEAQSPFVFPKLDIGAYDVIVRAYDTAQNYSESSDRLKITPLIFRPIQDKGLEIKSLFIIPWAVLWTILGILMLGLAYGAVRARKWHHHLDSQRLRGALPAELESQLQELKNYRQKYGKIAAVLAFVLISGLTFKTASAQTLNPPVISNISKDISNEEIFYVEGKTDFPGSEVILYLQNTESGETLSLSAKTDENGNWFYRHTQFLAPGNYVLWFQTKMGDEVSPPSSQTRLSVRRTALQFGSSRLSYETLYLIFIIAFFLVILLLLTDLIVYTYRGRKKYKLFLKEVREAEESIRRGFAVLRRDINAELQLVREAKLKNSLSEELQNKEKDLLKDLEWAEKYIGKEIWDVEHYGSPQV